MSSQQFGIEDARKQLGPLVDEVGRGTEVVLTRHGKPVARIVPAEERPTPTLAEWISTFRRFSTVPAAGDALGLDERDPTGWELAKAEVLAEAKPFAELVAGIDAFFGDELAEALSGPESAQAETEARRIIGEHLATVTMRLALTAAALSQANLVTATRETLQSLAGVLLQRAGDQRFIEVVSTAAKTPAV